MLRDGGRIEGIAKNHDNYSVQISGHRRQTASAGRVEISKIDFREGSLMPDDFGSRLSEKKWKMCWLI